MKNQKIVFFILFTIIILIISIILSDSAGDTFFFYLTAFTMILTFSYLYLITRKFFGVKLPYRIILNITIGILTVFFCLSTFLAFWYNYLFFPDDKHYLEKVSSSVKYTSDNLIWTEKDLIKDLDKAKIVNPLTDKDYGFLLDSTLREKNIYIDNNPYNKTENIQNLKYSTGKIFYYTYQKNSIVLKANSKISYNFDKNNDNRSISFDAVFPKLAASDEQGILKITFNGKTILEKQIAKEKKPRVSPFRYSNPFKSIAFYFSHPSKKLLDHDNGWETIQTPLPDGPGELSIEFIAPTDENNFLFLGSPVVLSESAHKRNDHVNVVYLIFDTLAKNHVDLYEFSNLYESKTPEEAAKILGKRNTITPVIDSMYGKICIFENMISCGQVTRASITPLWTSQFFTKSRLPVFRNIITDENKKEFSDQNFSSLPVEMSKEGYLTKQISCNSEGHGVSGVGVDLGFDENYDYTINPSEKTENIRKVIEFLNENQNKKFLLYAHINIPHPPRWIPMKYYIEALIDTDFEFSTSVSLGNIRYLNDCLEKIMSASNKLRLNENTLFIITADHSAGRSEKFRSILNDGDTIGKMKESQMVASFHSRAIYSREGSTNLYNQTMNIPFLMVPPSNISITPGKITSYISSIDIAPTILDITLNKKCNEFAGKSFSEILYNKKSRNDVFTDFIPLAGRFQRGFILNGKYKYWRNIQGLYKYRTTKDNMKLIMQQEYIYDLEQDPYERVNLALDQKDPELLNNMRKVYNEKFIDYPDKNFIQIAPSKDSSKHIYTVKVSSPDGTIIYPKTYGDGITINFNGKSSSEFTVPVQDKRMYFSFETNPSDSKLILEIYKDGLKLQKKDIFSSVECINIFDNPLVVSDSNDRFIAREPGKTGLEEKDVPYGAVYYSRVPLNYWLEMSKSESDIKLSPGMKEVLRGWGYIQ